MSARGLVLVGGGENARVLGELARAAGGWELLGYVDPSPCPLTEEALGLRRLGGDEEGRALAAQGAFLALALGELGVGRRRAALVQRYGASARWATLVHPMAWVSPSASLAQGVVVHAGAVVQTKACLGFHAVIGSGGVVEHDVRLGEFVQAGPAVVLGGAAEVGPGAYLGMGCRVRDHVRVGAAAMVAMGAVVVRDVPARALVMGVPARIRGGGDAQEP